MNLRVSVSDVDQLRYYLANEEMELDDLLARLRREGEETEPMRAGSALHKALENATEGEYDKLCADGYTFDLAIDGELDLPPLRELKAEKTYHVAGVNVTLVGKVDTIDGKRVDDHKTTSRFDVEKFYDSYQWRFYLDMFNADLFRWNVFVMRPDSKKAGHYIVSEFHQPTQHRYPALERDCQIELKQFVIFAQRYLPERFTEETANG